MCKQTQGCERTCTRSLKRVRQGQDSNRRLPAPKPFPHVTQSPGYAYSKVTFTGEPTVWRGPLPLTLLCSTGSLSAKKEECQERPPRFLLIIKFNLLDIYHEPENVLSGDLYDHVDSLYKPWKVGRNSHQPTLQTSRQRVVTWQINSSPRERAEISLSLYTRHCYSKALQPDNSQACRLREPSGREVNFWIQMKHLEK